jgi:glutamine synthetase
VLAFMQDFEYEALKLGMPIRTRHNEVAPSQFECAPTFEEVNLAIDHNLLLMDLMEKIAEKHDFKVLFHEKPFAGINGSGKHNNWSLGTNTGRNLLAPSSRPKENLMFLTFFINVIKAVHDYADLMRASIASAGNEHRLGANEAPPAIVSIFIGSQLAKVLEDLESKGEIKVDKGENMYRNLGIDKIPNILLDNTDRNRTSPFAFTGNKFEFRAVGSSANSANAMTVLNTIMGNQLTDFKKEVDGLIEKGEKKEVAIINILRRYVTEAKSIIFEGNGYSDEWKEEAARRGLKNIASTPEALDVYVDDRSVKLFEKYGIFSHRELEARHEIMLENYIKKIQIESRVMGDLVLNHVIPTAVKYQNVLTSNLKAMKEVGIEGKHTQNLVDTVKKISGYIDTLLDSVENMTEARKKANNTSDTREKAVLYNQEVKGYFDKIRYCVDKLELLVDDEDWPLVKYREMLLVR